MVTVEIATRSSVLELEGQSIPQLLLLWGSRFQEAQDGPPVGRRYFERSI